MDAKHQRAFLRAMQEMVNEKGISEEIVVEAIQEAFKVAYNKKLSDELLVVTKPIKVKKVKKFNPDGTEVKETAPKLADALIRCEIDLKKGTIDIARQWEVVEEDNLEDDFVQISSKDERVTSNKLKVGDFYEEPLSFDDFTKGDVNRFISAYKQKISRAEKENLLQTFEGKIGELITGVVEKADNSSVIVNLGRISVTLFQKDLIGKETFKPGDSIRVYVCGISKDDTKGGSLIHCSRSVPQFLEKIFANEVHEIYDGTVKIYKVARLSSIRSKVAVYSEDSNVDASGACIGPNGSRIQAIVSQLGNDRNSKEKIDVVEYSRNIGVFLRECLKPGVVLGAKIEETSEGQIAYVVCQDETGSAAIGFKGTNVILARQLTDLKEIKVMDESVAIEKGLEYKTMAEFESEARELNKEFFRKESAKNVELAANKYSNVDEVKPVVSDEEAFDDDEIEENELENDNSVVNVSPATEVVASEVQEEVSVVVPEIKEEVVQPEEIHEVKTTTTLDQLEASLEKEKKAEKEYKPREKDFKYKKKVAKTENKEEEVSSTIIDDKNKMSIYTEEELAELENEDIEENINDDDDYSEYDSDEYYDK